MAETHIPIPVEGYILVKDAAAATGYNPEYLRRLLRNGTLEGQRIGWSWFIRKESLHKWLQEESKNPLRADLVEKLSGPRE